MNLKAKIERIEKQLSLSGLDYHEELKRAFDGWSIEELANYAINGIRPEGKPIGHISYEARKRIEDRFRDWTDEELEVYATTGKKPEGKGL